MRYFAMSAPSRASKFIFRSSPPAYPVRLPLLPITRWQGMIILIGLCPTAPPIACADMLEIPFCRAISLSNIFISNYFSIRYLLQDFPYSNSEGCVIQQESRCKVRFLSTEIAIQPFGCLVKNGKIFFLSTIGQRTCKKLLAFEP